MSSVFQFNGEDDCFASFEVCYEGKTRFFASWIKFDLDWLFVSVDSVFEDNGEWF